MYNAYFSTLNLNLPTKEHFLKLGACAVLNEAYKRGWIATRDGNISIRSDQEFFISPSGLVKNSLVADSFVKGIIQNGEVGFEDGKLQKVSGELMMHSMLQLVEFGSDKPRVVVHLHPTYTIAAMLAGWELSILGDYFEELSRYTKVGQNVAAVPAVSLELAEETFKHLTSNNVIVYDIVGQKNHGVCAIAESPQKAFEHIERLEHVCQIVLASGIKPR